jgi:hypothetical protein
MALLRSRRDSGMNYWPGFVDALSTLILSIIFLLTVFMVAQFFLSQEVSGKNTMLARLTAQISRLAELLSLEKTGKANLEEQAAQLRAGARVHPRPPIAMLGTRNIAEDRRKSRLSQEELFMGQIIEKRPRTNGKIAPGTGHTSYRYWDSRAFPPAAQTGTQCRGAGARIPDQRRNRPPRGLGLVSAGRSKGEAPHEARNAAGLLG